MVELELIVFLDKLAKLPRKRFYRFSNFSSYRTRVINYLRKFREVILQAKGALPKASLIISYGISLIQLITLWLSMRDG